MVPTEVYQSELVPSWILCQIRLNWSTFLTIAILISIVLTCHYDLKWAKSFSHASSGAGPSHHLSIHSTDWYRVAFLPNLMNWINVTNDCKLNRHRLGIWIWSEVSRRFITRCQLCWSTRVLEACGIDWYRLQFLSNLRYLLNLHTQWTTLRPKGSPNLSWGQWLAEVLIEFDRSL
jgi:hypothetical protein